MAVACKTQQKNGAKVSGASNTTTQEPRTTRISRSEIAEKLLSFSMPKRAAYPKAFATAVRDHLSDRALKVMCRALVPAHHLPVLRAAVKGMSDAALSQMVAQPETFEAFCEGVLAHNRGLSRREQNARAGGAAGCEGASAEEIAEAEADRAATVARRNWFKEQMEALVALPMGEWGVACN